MIITISGRPGSGKGTVGRALAKKLKYQYYSIGDIRRAMAKERGMTLQEFNVLGEKKGFTDKEVDAWQTKLGLQRDNLVVEGRTSFYFIPHSVKLFFDVDLNVAAKRIFHDRSHARQFEASQSYKNAKELAHGLEHRIASDSRRYRKYYGINIFRPSLYDLVIDTTHQTPQQTLAVILKYLAKVSQKNTKGEKVGKTPKSSPAVSKKVGKTQRQKKR